MWYDTIRYDMLTSYLTWYDVMRYDMLWFDEMWIQSIWYGTIIYDMICYAFIWYGMVWYGITLYHTIRWYIVWYHVVRDHRISYVWYTYDMLNHVHASSGSILCFWHTRHLDFRRIHHVHHLAHKKIWHKPLPAISMTRFVMLIFMYRSQGTVNSPYETYIRAAHVPFYTFRLVFFLLLLLPAAWRR